MFLSAVFSQAVCDHAPVNATMYCFRYELLNQTRVYVYRTVRRWVRYIIVIDLELELDRLCNPGVVYQQVRDVRRPLRDCRQLVVKFLSSRLCVGDVDVGADVVQHWCVFYLPPVVAFVKTPSTCTHRIIPAIVMMCNLTGFVVVVGVGVGVLSAIG